MREFDIHTALLRARVAALASGAVGLSGALILLFVAPDAFFPGYLTAFAFWVGLSLGSMAILMLHHLVGGEWGFVARRILESGARTISLMAVFVIPILFGLDELYPWTRDDLVEASEKLLQKAEYLNEPWFVFRSIFYFAVWIVTATLLGRWSRKLSETRSPQYLSRLRVLSAVGLIAYVVLGTLASVDWLMSLEPKWYSSIFGWMVEVSHGLTGIGLAIVLVCAFERDGTLGGTVRTTHLHDWGNLLLAFVTLWAYFMFAQYLIVWSGNVPEEIHWYTARKEGGWFWVGPALIVLHFAIPFALLLMRGMKKKGRRLAGIALWVLSAHLLFVCWLVLPASENSAPTFVAAAASTIGLGGCWAALFLTHLLSQPLIPGYDPRFVEMSEERPVS